MSDKATNDLGPVRKPLSVVIPAHGTAEYLEEAIRSASRSSVVERVVVVCDASPSDLEVARRVAAGDSKVLVVELVGNVGLCRARNRGLVEVDTPWVHFLDSDDVAIAGAYERLLASLPAEGVPDVLTGAWDILDRDGSIHPDASPLARQRRHHFTSEGSQEEGAPLTIDSVLLGNTIGHPLAAVFSTPVLRGAGGWSVVGQGFCLTRTLPNLYWASEDGVLGVAETDVPLVHYRRREGQETQNASFMRRWHLRLGLPWLSDAPDRDLPKVRRALRIRCLRVIRHGGIGSTSIVTDLTIRLSWLLKLGYVEVVGRIEALRRRHRRPT
jgi:glycosyltransferase involved in cell wall biosynthesis